MARVRTCPRSRVIAVRKIVDGAERYQIDELKLKVSTTSEKYNVRFAQEKKSSDPFALAIRNFTTAASVLYFDRCQAQ